MGAVDMASTASNVVNGSDCGFNSDSNAIASLSSSNIITKASSSAISTSIVSSVSSSSSITPDCVRDDDDDRIHNRSDSSADIFRPKFCGWGSEQGMNELDTLLVDNVTRFIGDFLKLDHRLEPILKAPNLDEIHLRNPRFTLPSHLLPLCSSSTLDRVSHSYGKSFRDLIRCLNNEFTNPTDYVAFPKTEEDIQQLMQFCEKNKVGLIPYGGGTSLVGGVEPSMIPGYLGSITLSMKFFCRVKEVDLVSRSALIEAGIFGPQLEDQLKTYGLSLRYFPQSFEFSTLGGWIATNGVGYHSTLHTRIDDFVQSLRIVTPSGIIETNRFPSSATEPNRLFIGSEGSFGVITEAWMRLQACSIVGARLARNSL